MLRTTSSASYPCLILAPQPSQSSVLLVAASDHEEDVKKDLFAVITLQGGPCGKVVTFQRMGKNDYLAECQTGDRYRVNVTPEGRVAVGKHQNGHESSEASTPGSRNK